MKKPSSRIRQEISKLQEQLKQAETREAERIGRIALRSGLSDIEIEETDLQAAFSDLAKRFRTGKLGTPIRKGAEERSAGSEPSQVVTSGAASGSAGEA